MFRRKTVFVQIRGATSYENKILSYNNIMVPYPPARGAFVHGGCMTALNEIKETMVATVVDQVALYRDFKIHVIGHSFGGCIASLAGLELIQRVKNLKLSNLSVYTLGKPRLGNLAFVQYHDSTGMDHKRIVSKSDSVPHQPSLLNGYIHEGVEHWIYDDAQNMKKCLGGESRNCSNSIHFKTIVDHLSYLDTNEGCSLAFN